MKEVTDVYQSVWNQQRALLREVKVIIYSSGNLKGIPQWSDRKRLYQLTVPTWLVWNCIIAPKFVLPQFTFSETFFVLSIIKFIFSSTDYRKLYNDINKK